MKTLKKYERVFDSQNPNWKNNLEINLLYLKARQVYLNDILRVRGHLILNEVYDTLGFPRTKSGCIAGWVYDESNQVGDNFVDFGMEVCEERKPDILLNFNVVENVIDVIFKEEES